MKGFSGWLLRRLGWHVEGELPGLRQYLIIAGPHTSNWDFVMGMLARTALGQKVRFLGKHQLFRFPFGWLFRALGGYPVVRHRANALVAQVVQYFRDEPDFVLGLAPEGTRSPVKRWKLGFYHIAREAGVPVVMVGLDFGRRRFVISEPLWPGEEMEADLDQIRTFFLGITGRHPKVIPPGLGYFQD
ncbi:lysophospholipid acyltransferase family protein [Gallaecimonas sp. GXIMD4217]|uniref:lysophospholipid acyltransferase family protein n=1 Tax=Gallaecimonas sp. GXIMD4217 TaxID=3131927 RepID=UPI00311B0B9E